MTTTALQQLLTELDAAPAGCLDDVRRWMRTLAMEMMHTTQPYGRMYDRVSSLVAERDAARADVERLTHADEIGLAAANRATAEAILQRDAARVEVERLTSQRDAYREQRDAFEADIGTLNQQHAAEVERLAKERDEARAGHAAVFNEMMGRPTIEEHRAEVTRLKLMINDAQRRAREDAERETVTAIAKWLYAESSRFASTAQTREACDRNQRPSALANATDSLRAGTWKETP